MIITIKFLYATLHIYYSLFLLAAAASQVAYGILFVLVTLSRDSGLQRIEKKSDRQVDKTMYTKQKAISNYRRIMIIN
ncbi:MAG: hypothetical protein ACRD8W_19620, partial [Nitrososphaeraceae archaeon]